MRKYCEEYVTEKHIWSLVHHPQILGKLFNFQKGSKRFLDTSLAMVAETYGLSMNAYPSILTSITMAKEYRSLTAILKTDTLEKEILDVMQDSQKH